MQKIDAVSFSLFRVAIRNDIYGCCIFHSKLDEETCIDTITKLTLVIFYHKSNMPNKTTMFVSTGLTSIGI